MHLTECIDLFSESNAFDSEVRECLYNWHFKTSTNFLNADLQLNLLFGALCWSFTFGGLSMLVLKPKWAHLSNFPYMTYAYTLIFIQGPLSCWADYINMANDSIAHVIDRSFAVIMFAAFLWRITSLFYFARPSNFFMQLAAFSFAMFCFMNGQDAQEAYDIEGWKFWHNLWHCFPFFVAAIEIYDRYFLGEYDCDSKQLSCISWYRRVVSNLSVNVKSSLIYPGTSISKKVKKN
mmetsp:Transcript_17187/g.32532  ORF Transcript_17187/g.32532 Transcript_17187/m.32532 type:complete len:235 (-) Transcript_17187:70-774(-)